MYQTGTRTFIITELYRHIPRSCRIFNRWYLVYYTGQPYAPRKKPTEPEQPDKDHEELMSTSGAGEDTQKDNSDDESSASFEKVEETNTGLSSKRNLDRETEEPCTKKQTG